MNKCVPRGPTPKGTRSPRETAVRMPEAEWYRRNSAASAVVRSTGIARFGRVTTGPSHEDHRRVHTDIALWMD